MLTETYIEKKSWIKTQTQEDKHGTYSLIGEYLL